MIKLTAVFFSTTFLFYTNVASAKDLTVGGYPSYPPIEMSDPLTGQTTGFDVDLAGALSKVMGVKITFSETSFSQLISSIQTGRIDFFMSAMTDTPERRKTVTFVDYIQAGTQVMTLKSQYKSGVDIIDFCGKRVSASRSTDIMDQLRSWSNKHCKAAGKKDMIVQGAENNIDARMQLKQGRADAMAQDSLSVPYVQNLEKDVYISVGDAFNMSNLGMGVSIQNKSLQQDLKNAMQELIDDGQYAALIKKWDLPENTAIPKALINGE